NPDLGIFLLRLAVAAVFLVHGLPKFGKLRGIAAGTGMPVLVVLLLALVESLSALGLITGVLIQWSALGLMVVMLGAISFKVFKWKVPFKADQMTGWEFDFMLLVSSIVILLTSGGSIKLWF
ncbi:MAG: DoxX family protein, partial [Candidatus Paceibacterota bacterium]